MMEPQMQDILVQNLHLINDVIPTAVTKRKSWLASFS